MRYRRIGQRIGCAYRCPDCGCYYDYCGPIEYGCRFCGCGRSMYATDYFPRDVEYWTHPYGYRKKRHYFEEPIEVTKEERKVMLREELKEIEEEIAEIKEELKEIEAESQ